MESNTHPQQGNVGRINRILTVAPVICSLIAMAIVGVNVAAGVLPQRDEGTSAHLYQLLMAIQVPLVIGFAASSDWKRPTRPLLVMAVQGLAICASLGALAWSGY